MNKLNKMILWLLSYDHITRKIFISHLIVFRGINFIHVIFGDERENVTFLYCG